MRKQSLSPFLGFPLHLSVLLPEMQRLTWHIFSAAAFLQLSLLSSLFSPRFEIGKASASSLSDPSALSPLLEPVHDLVRGHSLSLSSFRSRGLISADCVNAVRKNRIFKFNGRRREHDEHCKQDPKIGPRSFSRFASESVLIRGTDTKFIKRGNNYISAPLENSNIVRISRMKNLP